MSDTTVSLVLGSGGARGLAHIGVIHWLEEHGYRIATITGCSIGALIGGAYAAGKLDEVENWMRAITRVDMLRLLDLSWDRSGLVKGDRIINSLRGLIGDIDIDDLPMPFTAIATSIDDEKEVWMQSGSLFAAIRASISLPLLFTPYEHKGKLLIDGGVLNPVPIAPTFGDHTDLTIAVNLNGERRETHEERKPEPPENIDVDTTLHRRIASYIARLTDSIADSWNDDEPDRHDMYDIVHQVIDAMQGTIARQKLAAYPPDNVIEIPRSACHIMEFDRAAELIDLGYRLAGEQLDTARTANR